MSSWQEIQQQLILLSILPNQNETKPRWSAREKINQFINSDTIRNLFTFNAQHSEASQRKVDCIRHGKRVRAVRSDIQIEKELK